MNIIAHPFFPLLDEANTVNPATIDISILKMYNTHMVDP